MSYNNNTEMDIGPKVNVGIQYSGGGGDRPAARASSKGLASVCQLVTPSRFHMFAFSNLQETELGFPM